MKKIPWFTLLTICIAVIYFIIPVDILPEVLLGPIGYIDDGVVGGLVIGGIKKDIDRIKESK